MIYSIPLYDALLGANVAPDKAKAVVQAFETETTTMTANLATKADVASIRADLALLESRMTVKLGAMMCALAGLVFAAIKLF
jgi:hypothetical protein